METLWIGTYTDKQSEGIYSAHFDSETGRISDIKLAVEASDPAFLLVSKDGKHLFAVDEGIRFDGQNGGGVLSYTVTGNGTLTKNGRQPTHADHPCYLALSADCTLLFATSYTGGDLTVFPISAQGVVESVSARKKFEGHSIHPTNQKRPHMHCVALSPDKKHLWMCDLGSDRVYTYPFDGAQVDFDKPTIVEVPAGYGPRHIAFHPTLPIAYVVTELSNHVLVIWLDSNGEPVGITQDLSALPVGYNETSTCAAIRVSADGKFLYATNRGHNSIALFQIDKKGALQEKGHFPSGGKSPRELAFSKDGNWLLCANQDTGINVMKVNKSDGALIEVFGTDEVSSPSCLAFG